MSTQPNYSTRQRTFDYIQKHWLEKTTGRPAHEWDLYIVKELLDNALDADEAWMLAHGDPVELTVRMRYRRNEKSGSFSLSVAVCNRAPFPVDGNLLAAIFDLTAYTSDKSHTNKPSRGQQGNALKTVLGIPYALRHHFFGDYANILKPLTIETDGQVYDVSLEIEELGQIVSLARIEPAPLAKPHPHTCVRVGIDSFLQERPRTLFDVYTWAQRFACINPHATFHWHVQFGGQRETWGFQSQPGWSGLFADTAPIHWYEYTQLRELLLAIERELGPDTPLKQVLQTFAGFTAQEDAGDSKASELCDRLGFQTLADLRLIDDHGRTLRDGLWPALLSEGRRVPAEKLGCLGEAHVAAALAGFFDLEEPPLYRCVVHEDPDDLAHPFVLELALARLPGGRKREIWTGLNHTPNYQDPFYTRLLYPPGRPDEDVFGLDGFLDAYGQTAAQPVLLLVHIICPNLAYQDFSKSVIETRPFSKVLARTLHELLTEFTAVETTQIEDLQETVHALIPDAIRLLSPDGRHRFSTSQLLRAVRRLLAQQLAGEDRADFAETWLADPEATVRLQTYIQAYNREHEDVALNLIQAERDQLTLPVHPSGHSSVPLSEVSPSLLDEACVNKLLLVADAEMESVIVANDLLARFDMALLRAEGNFDASFDALLRQMNRIRLPLILLHHATGLGCLLADRLRFRLVEDNLAEVKLFDLGLTPSDGQALGLPAEMGTGAGDRAALSQHLAGVDVAFLLDRKLEFSLFSLSPRELSDWLAHRFDEQGLSPKQIPEEAGLRAAGLAAMRQTLSDWVLHRFHEVSQVTFLADQVIAELAAEINTDQMPQKLREALQREPTRAWRPIWTELVTEHCQEILQRRHEDLDKLIAAHKPLAGSREDGRDSLDSSPRP